MNKYLVFLFLQVLGFLQAQETKLSPLEVETVTKAVSVQAKKHRTIFNTFVQLKHIDFLSNDIESRGDLYFKSPDMIKWSYTQPYMYSVIFKNKKLYINDAGKKRDVNLASTKVFEKLHDLIAKSVRGDMLTDDQFMTALYKEKDRYIAKLHPKDETLRTMFQQIVLSFDKTTFLVKKIKLMEPSGDYTSINFENVHINQPIPDAIFTH